MTLLINYLNYLLLYKGAGLVEAVPGRGCSYCKGVSGDVLLKWVPKSASWYNNDPFLFSAKADISLGHIFKILYSWYKNRPNFLNLISKFLKFACINFRK